MPIELDFYVPLGAWGSYFAGLQSIEVCQKDVVACPNGCDMGDHVARRYVTSTPLDTRRVLMRSAANAGSAWSKSASALFRYARSGESG